MKKVAFLFDLSNDWLEEYFSKNFHSSKKYEFHNLYDERDVRGYDIVFVLGYTKLLKGKIFESNDLLLVIHESDLPQGRGFAPVQWQILQNINNITVCLLKVSTEADMGDICEKMITTIPVKKTFILKFLNLSLLLDLRITNDAIIHNIGI